MSATATSEAATKPARAADVANAPAAPIDGNETASAQAAPIDGSETASAQAPPIDGSETASAQAPPIDGSETASAPALPASYPANVPVPDPSDYAVHRDGRITVQAAETLGHYAEWLEVRTSRLRRLNGMNFDTPVVIGRKAKLDFSRVTPETFEERRLGYHHALQEEYFAAFEVVGTLTHILRPGDSLWYLAERKYEVPVWLIHQFNPDLDFGAFHAGTRMIIPEVGRRES